MGLTYLKVGKYHKSREELRLHAVSSVPGITVLTELGNVDTPWLIKQSC